LNLLFNLLSLTAWDAGFWHPLLMGLGFKSLLNRCSRPSGTSLFSSYIGLILSRAWVNPAHGSLPLRTGSTIATLRISLAVWTLPLFMTRLLTTPTNQGWWRIALAPSWTLPSWLRRRGSSRITSWWTGRTCRLQLCRNWLYSLRGNRLGLSYNLRLRSSLK